MNDHETRVVGPAHRNERTVIFSGQGLEVGAQCFLPARDDGSQHSQSKALSIPLQIAYTPSLRPRSPSMCRYTETQFPFTADHTGSCIMPPFLALRFLIPCLLACSVFLTGCGSGSGRSSAVLRIWYSTDDPVERQWSQVLIRQFESTHPHLHLHVDLTDYSFEDLNTKLQLALSGGTPPDLAYVTPRGPGIPAYVGAHRLADLTAPARQYGWAGRLRAGLLESYNTPFQYYGSPRRGIVAVPMALAAVAVLYNRHLLQMLHLDIPHTLAAFGAALGTATRAGYTPLGLGNADGWLGDDWYLTLVNALVPPARLQSEQRLSHTFSFRAPPYLEAARHLQQWAQSNYFTQDFGGLDAQESIDQFFTGHTLFQLVSSSQNSQILADERRTSLPIGVFAFPGAGGRGVMPVSGYLGWVVPVAGAHRSDALAFINSILSQDTARFLLEHGVLPSTRLAMGQRVGLSHGFSSWQQEYLAALNSARPGIYLDAAPISNLNATMEANVQLLLQGYEAPEFLVGSLEKVYVTRGRSGSTTRIDGEF